ncbi:hypothetical protein [Pseudomonas entomophila]|uniref:hypothetical protein n=1 Tax=Pseudomonas entomophila TaxID=312306 RepID=UPI001F030252|nr:hypothetical protein [Pseudomonas entomophila]MCG8291440.1 hypothetical protein [Pseudomonas entomophila]
MPPLQIHAGGNEHISGRVYNHLRHLTADNPEFLALKVAQKNRKGLDFDWNSKDAMKYFDIDPEWKFRFLNRFSTCSTVRYRTGTTRKALTSEVHQKLAKPIDDKPTNALQIAHKSLQSAMAPLKAYLESAPGIVSSDGIPKKQAYMIGIIALEYSLLLEATDATDILDEVAKLCSFMDSLLISKELGWDGLGSDEEWERHKDAPPLDHVPFELFSTSPYQSVTDGSLNGALKECVNLLSSAAAAIALNKIATESQRNSLNVINFSQAYFEKNPGTHDNYKQPPASDQLMPASRENEEKIKQLKEKISTHNTNKKPFNDALRFILNGDRERFASVMKPYRENIGKINEISGKQSWTKEALALVADCFSEKMKIPITLPDSQKNIHNKATFTRGTSDKKLELAIMETGHVIGAASDQLEKNERNEMLRLAADTCLYINTHITHAGSATAAKERETIEKILSEQLAHLKAVLPTTETNELTKLEKAHADILKNLEIIEQTFDSNSYTPLANAVANTLRNDHFAHRDGKQVLELTEKYIKTFNQQPPETSVVSIPS